MPVRIVLACGFLVLALSGAARADGCYIPERAIQKLPEIPAQRALVAFRDGRETLIVESALEGQGRRFGWIIPVPAKPDAIEAATPGTLKSLAMGIQPRIVHDTHGGMILVIAFCVIALVLTIAATRGGVSSFMEWLVVVLIVLVLFGLLLPAGMSARGQPLQNVGVAVLEKARVGSYEVSVLAADDAQALYAWLQSEDLAVPQTLRPAVDDYARRGWKFVTARLTTDGAGPTIPHPLRIVFRTKEAVYPMRLTGLSGRVLDLELFVVGEQAAEVEGLKREFCDRFWPLPEHTDLETAAGTTVRTGRSFRGEGSHQDLGHPGFSPVLWSGCWVSKLTGRVAAANMDQDYVVAWRKPGFERQTLYSHRGAGSTAFAAALLAFTFVTLFTFITGRIRCWSFRRHAAVIGAGLFLAAVLFGMLKLALPQIEVVAGRGMRFRHEPHYLAYVIKDMGEEHKNTVDSREQIVAQLQRHSNLFTGELVREEDSPGNYTVAGRDGKLAFTLYGLGGTPVTVELKGSGDGR
jgi:hypothetical protein